jgi:hypothetical protein
MIKGFLVHWLIVDGDAIASITKYESTILGEVYWQWQWKCPMRTIYIPVDEVWRSKLSNAKTSSSQSGRDVCANGSLAISTCYVNSMGKMGRDANDELGDALETQLDARLDHGNALDRVLWSISRRTQS